MASICWKCGAEVADGAPSCARCGAAVAGTGGQQAQPFGSAAPMSTPGQGYSSPPPPPAAAPFQPAAPPAFQPSAAPAQQGFAPVQQGYSPAPPPPPSSGVPQAAAGGKGGNTAVKVILIVLGIIAMVVILVVAVFAYGCYRIAHAVHQAANGERSISIPGSNGGSLSVNSEGQHYSAAELGTDPYPGATTTKGGMKLNTPAGSWLTAVYLTSDSKDTVEAFYKDKLGSDVSTMDINDTAILTKKVSDQEQVMVTISQKANEDNGKTKILISHTKNTKSS